MKRWEAYGGIVPVKVGKRPNGKPHSVLMIETFIVMTAADAKAVEKACPGLKFKKVDGTAPSSGATSKGGR
jgi:hypothetical protein